MISLTNSQIGELMGQFLLAGTGTLSFAILFACPLFYPMAPLTLPPPEPAHLCAGGCHGLVRV